MTSAAMPKRAATANVTSRPLHDVGRDTSAGLELCVAGGRAQHRDEHRQSQRRPHLLGDVHQAGRRPGVSGVDVRPAPPASGAPTPSLSRCRGGRG